MQSINQQISKQKYVSGFKRSYREFLNQDIDNKNIVIDVELINHIHERNNFHSKSISLSESIKEEKKLKKDVGFGFKN